MNDDTTYTMPGVEEMTRRMERIHASPNVRIDLFPLIVGELHDRTFTERELANELYRAFDRYIVNLGEEMRNTQFRYLPMVLDRVIDNNTTMVEAVTKLLREINDMRYATRAA